MRGLLLKDLLNLKKQWVIIGVLIIFYALFSFKSGNGSMLGGVLGVLAAMMPVTAFSFDEKAKWDKYALSMPVSRADLVLSKYLFGFGFCVVAFAVNLVFNFLLDSGGGFMKTLLISYALFAAALFFMLLLLPVLFRFGVEKGRLLMLAILLLPTAAVTLGVTSGGGLPDEHALMLLLKLSPFLVILLAAGSMVLSLKIYARKEF